MSIYKKVMWLLMSLAAVLVLPLLGGIYKYGGHFPVGFFTYPITYAHEKPPFSWTVFLLIGFGVLFLLVLYLFPKLFGFKKVNKIDKPKIDKVSFPKWFWCGWGLFIGVTTVMWGHFSGP